MLKQKQNEANSVLHFAFLCQREGLISHNLATGTNCALSNGTFGSKHDLKIWVYVLSFQILVKVH